MARWLDGINDTLAREAIELLHNTRTGDSKDSEEVGHALGYLTGYIIKLEHREGELTEAMVMLERSLHKQENR